MNIFPEFTLHFGTNWIFNFLRQFFFSFFSFNSNADFEELEQVHHPQYRRQDIRRSSRSAHMTKSNIDLRRVGSQLQRNHSSSPAGKRIQSARRYSPPQGSTGKMIVNKQLKFREINLF